MSKELLRRHPANPILRPEDLPFLANAIYNPGAVRYGEKYVLVPRVEDGRRDNRLHLAWSDDGVHFDLDPDPIPLPPLPAGELPEKHLYDPRVTCLEGAYYIVYCSQDFDETVRIGAIRTADFKTFERLPFLTAPWSRNSALFPEKIRDAYCRFERPMSGNHSINLISYSPDLVHWGRWEPVRIEPQTWLREKWGCGPPPVKTPEGWLQIIHGVWLACNYVYRIGALLLDLDNPARVIGQCPHFILTPREPYERVGETLNCVFSNGAILDPDGELKVYYGAADTCIGLATCRVEELLDACRKGGRPAAG